MLPLPTAGAIATFVGLSTILAVGMAFESSAVLVLANAGFVGLALAFAATLPLGRRVRRQRLEFAWWVAHGTDGTGTVVVPNAPFALRCYIRHRGDGALTVRKLDVIAGSTLTSRVDPELAIDVRGRARTEFSLPLSASAVGRLVLHGLAVSIPGPLGLFEMPLYFPNPMAIKVLPRAARRPPLGSRTVLGAPLARSGRNVLRRRGGGTELHELRDLLPGDPFKSIAWKASARAGRLMVKEVEREVQETLWIVLDADGTLRDGPPGRRELDVAIELAAAEARRSIEEGDRVGLVVVDGRLVTSLPPKDGAGQLVRIYDALLQATEVVDADRTSADDREVARIVAAYVQQQDGLDFRRRREPLEVDVSGLTAHVVSLLANERVAGRPRASSAEGSTLRRFCRSRGIALPHRLGDPDRSKDQALADALRIAGAHRREPARVVVVSDLEGVRESGPLRTSVRLLRAHGHDVAFLVPDAMALAEEPRDPLVESLQLIYGLREKRRIREARRAFDTVGARVVVSAPPPAAGGDHVLGPRRGSFA